MSHRKPQLPTKCCAVCGRPFAWRRRWARCWDTVRYCSDACRGRRRPTWKKPAPDHGIASVVSVSIALSSPMTGFRR
ncbi:MAG: DUF2256 domain-containing protein [Chromatiaceae bacterium]